MMAFISDRRRSRTTVLLIALGSTILSARADMIVTDGMQPWETCAECHGLDGISVMARFPKLAGQPVGYIAKQVRDIRDGRRRNDGGQMAAIAGEIDDDDLAKSAAYFADLPPRRPTPRWQRTRRIGGVAPHSIGTAMRFPASRDAVPVTTTRSQNARTRRC